MAKGVGPVEHVGPFPLILNCDAADVLLRAFAGRALGLPSFVAGVEALRPSFTPVGTFATRFGPGQHDGAALIRVAAFANGHFTYQRPTSAACP